MISLCKWHVKECIAIDAYRQRHSHEQDYCMLMDAFQAEDTA
jgi:hypothetical protein